LEPNVGLEKIRQAGICKHYEQLKNKGLSPGECLTETKDFARVEKRQTVGILTGKVQPTGKKVLPFSKYLYEIEMIEVAIKSSGNSKKEHSLKQIYDNIRKDKNLNDDEKQALEAQLKNVSQKIKKLSSVK
jgi:hypothetical protein